ncbi:MAG: HDOD domain-containing protein [Lachnospiraceae bacterium]|nr:HDOD domain-containing protein [Lachnospiraceae bacterium]
MLATLIPLFDENMVVSSYSIFVQKDNFLLNPSFMGSGRFDGATHVEGLEIVDSIGMETLSGDKDVFVEINNVSIFSNVDEQCGEPHGRIVFLVDDTVAPVKDYIDRLKELKSKGYKLAIQKLPIEKFEPYREILSLMDYILLNHKKIKIEVAKVYFGKVYPNIRLCAVNVETQEEFDKLKADGGYDLYEGSFFRKPRKTEGTEVAPLKVNYIELLNVVNDSDFDLSDAAKVIGRDTALVISLLEMVNRMTVNKGISSVAHAASMLGQKELKRWINTAVTKELCADRPSEITRLSMLRAKFAENLAQVFEMPMQANELFLMGLFSVLDVILDKPIEEALKMVKVSKEIEDALIKGTGNFAPVMDFVVQYENAFWQEVSRQMVLSEIDMDAVYNAYIESLRWYRDLFSNK